MFQKEEASADVKQRSITVEGVNRWNDLKIEMTLCNTAHVFKAIFRKIILVIITNDYYLSYMYFILFSLLLLTY